MPKLQPETPKPQQDKLDQSEPMVSLIYKSAVITIYLDDIDSKFMPAILLHGESKLRLLDVDGCDSIARAVKLARTEIDKYA